MQRLECVHLVQFFLFEAQTLELGRTSAIIAPNGAGKSALLDALQIVLLGADRGRIRFNAQAGGSHRARSIRDYCLGVYRGGDDGRKRRTATTYLSLVFRDEASGLPLTAGIALGASADEPEHRVHGLYLLPGVALRLDEHLEQANGRELPLAWPQFREAAVARCKAVGTRAELPPNGERFLKELLFRLRASPAAQPDLHAFRKAFQNALNLQRVEDVDLFVRTLVAEDRPTDIVRFHSLLDSFRQIKEKIEDVQRRIGEAESVETRYAAIAREAVRAASCRALGADYERDLFHEQVDQAEDACRTADGTLAATQRRLTQARAARELARDEHATAQARLQGSQGYADQGQFEALLRRDRERLAQLQRELQRELAHLRDLCRDAATLELPTPDIAALGTARQVWSSACDALADVAADAPLPWGAEALHTLAAQTLIAARPVLDAVAGYARTRHATVDALQDRLKSARQNQKRLAAGQTELHPDAVRLIGYLEDAGIAARPVCDLVRVVDPAWQPAIEAYLRSNTEALLIALADEERAVKLYRSLQGGRSVYGVKLALSSHTRSARDAAAAAGSVAALLDGDKAEAVAYLRRQLGELRCVESEADLVRSRQGLTRDGLLAKGGSIERLRLPAAIELRIGATDQRERARALRAEVESVEAELRALQPELDRLDRCQSGLARLRRPDEVAQALSQRAFEHEQALQRYRHAQTGRAEALDPDLLRLSEHVRALDEALRAQEQALETLVGDEREATNRHAAAARLLEGLRRQETAVVRRAVEAFAHADADPERVERQRAELEEKFPRLEERIERCRTRAQESDASLTRLVPDAWTALQQYAKDRGLGIDFASDAWRAALALVRQELTQLRDADLARYQGEAQTAYATAVETFRSNVAATLYDNFSKLKTQIHTLNRTLRGSPAFSNNERYQFHYDVVPEFRALHRFIQRVADVGGEDNLFGSAGDVPPAFRELIEDRAAARPGASPLDDYRRFFAFEVQIRQDDRVIGTLSERMRSGSGGEHRAPLYVIAGAALAAAYGKSETQTGGLGLILLDEFGDKIDAQNARATTDYLRSLGLQLVLAAPDTAQGTLSGVLDSYIELFRDGDLLQAERIEITPAARDLLLSDQFDLHPELLAEEAARIARERRLA